MNLAARMYLDLLVATEYPEQEPAWQAARWYHLFWLLIPIMGWMVFVMAVEEAYGERVST